MRGYWATVWQPFWDKQPLVLYSESRSMELKFITHTFQPNGGNWFFSLSTPPSSDRRAAHHWGCITLACLRGCVYRVEGGKGACAGVYVCVRAWTGAAPSGQSLRLSLCTGRSTAMLMLMHSQWPRLRSQRCASRAATRLQLKTEGCLFGVGKTDLGYLGPCGEQAHISQGKQTRRTNCAYTRVHQIIPLLIQASSSPWQWFYAI